MERTITEKGNIMGFINWLFKIGKVEDLEAKVKILTQQCLDNETLIDKKDKLIKKMLRTISNKNDEITLLDAVINSQMRENSAFKSDVSKNRRSLIKDINGTWYL